MNLPDQVDEALKPLFEALPLNAAMEALVVTGRRDELVGLVEKTVANPSISGLPPLCAALWLYIDDLARSHTISQGIEDATGSFWHGIMHRREGDFDNSHYWFNRVGRHPAMEAMPGYDGHAFIDEVARMHNEAPAALIGKQRTEWRVLFEWCAAQGE